MTILLANADGEEAAPPRYRCYKEVSAMKITDVVPTADGGAILRFDGFMPIQVEHDVVRRYMPVDGDYFVIYEPDGYRSISPGSVFEDGYDLIA